MKQIPQPTKVRYGAMLAQYQISKKIHPHYMKWLRYYLDFCQKYHFEKNDKKSLPHFIDKLKAKNQTNQQQKQAFDAISIFYEIESLNYGNSAP